MKISFFIKLVTVDHKQCWFEWVPQELSLKIAIMYLGAPTMVFHLQNWGGNWEDILIYSYLTLFLLHCPHLPNSSRGRQITAILTATLQMRTVLLMSCLVGTWTSETFCSTFLFFLPSCTFTSKTRGVKWVFWYITSAAVMEVLRFRATVAGYFMNLWWTWLSEHKWTARGEFLFKFDCEHTLPPKQLILWLKVQYERFLG